MNAKTNCGLICTLILSASAVVAADTESANELQAVRLAQAEGSETDAAKAQAEADATAAAGVDEVLEELEQVEASESGEYDEDEDDKFIPTQEVSSDQSIKFPVDI